MNILALDIGSAQIKCAVIDTKWKGFDVVYHDVLSVPDALEELAPTEELLSPGQQQTLLEIQRRYTHNVDRIIINIPLSLYSTRVMHFPFKDFKKIQAAVNFQVEDEIPFDIEDCIISPHIYTTKAKDAHVLVGIAPLETLKAYIASMQSVGVDPDVLAAEEAAYSSLLGHQKNLPNQSITLINLGHRKSSITIFKDGVPVLHRTSMHGGFHVTQAIAQKYEISMAEAELAKLDKAFVATPGMELSAEQKLFSDVIEGSLDPILHDFDQTLMAFTSRFNQQVDQIYISGGTSLLPGLVEVLSSRWNRKVLPFHWLSKLPHVSIRPQKSTELVLPTAVALGVSQVRNEYKANINFRSGALKREQSAIKLDWAAFAAPLRLALIAYVFAFISLAFQYVFLKRDLAQLQAKQEASIKSILQPPNASALALLKGNPARLKQNIDKKVSELQSQVQETRVSSASTLDLIQSLSRNVNFSAKTEIKEMNLKGNQLSLKLESPTQRDAESALKMLTAMPDFVGPKASAVETAGNRKKFSISTQVAPKAGKL